MSTAPALRQQIEAALWKRIPSALTPAPRTIRPVAPTGIDAVDALLHGGFPVGAITEIAGPESSGRTSLTLSFLAEQTGSGKVCAWIDVSDALQPEAAAAAGVDLERLLWVRCGVRAETRPSLVAAAARVTLPGGAVVAPPIKRGLHGGGHGPHPRTEVKGLSTAVSTLFRPELIVARVPEAHGIGAPPKVVARVAQPAAMPVGFPRSPVAALRPYARIEQGLRVADLLLQAGGFSAIVLDMAGIAAEFSVRVPLATWFRYRAAAERTQSSIVLLTQSACARSSAGLVLRMHAETAGSGDTTVLRGFPFRMEATRERFQPTAPSNVIPLRKPPQREQNPGRTARWRGETAWAGQR